MFRSFRRDEAGASLIEFAIVISLFLLVFFALLDFGRLGFNYVMTEKAMQRAARIAAVRPPVCANVPTTHGKKTSADARFGTLCSAGNVCENGGIQQCVLNVGADFACAPTAAIPSTAEEIWCTLEPILPNGAVPGNFRVTYSFDPNLGFAGGPYTPMVEVGVVTEAESSGDGALTGASPLLFPFITPLSSLAGLMGGSVTRTELDGTTTTIDTANSIPFPNMSVSLPAEDLAQGMDG